MIRQLISINSKSVYLLILAASMVAVIFAAQWQQVYATGYEQGKADAQSGIHDSTCPPSLSNDETACGLYKADYERGYLAWKAVHSGDTDRFNTDDGEIVNNDNDD
jgi:hypothetical protein